jgi:hypothetical protein
MCGRYLALSLFCASSIAASTAHAIQTHDFVAADSVACESVLNPADFEKSEAFRKQLWDGIRKKMGAIESARRDYMNLLDLELENRSDFSPHANINSALADKLGLSANRMTATPLVAQATKDAMKRFMNRAATDDYQELRLQLREAVKVDPYFKWLKEAGVDGRSKIDQVKRGSYTVEGDNLVPVRVSSDPVEYLFSRVDISGPGMLPIDLALVRVYRDLDPELTSKQHMLADSILKLYGIEVLIHLDYREQFLWRNNGWASKEAWDLAPNLNAALKNYRLLLDKQKTLDKHMSPKGYRLAKQMFEEQGEATEMLRRLLNEGEEKPGDREAFVQLKKRLTLDQKYSVRQVFDMIVYAGNSRVSHVQFMMRIFGGEEGKRDDRTLSGLRKIIDIAEALQSEDAFREFLREALGKAFYIQP